MSTSMKWHSASEYQGLMVEKRRAQRAKAKREQEKDDQRLRMTAKEVHNGDSSFAREHKVAEKRQALKFKQQVLRGRFADKKRNNLATSVGSNTSNASKMINNGNNSMELSSSAFLFQANNRDSSSAVDGMFLASTSLSQSALGHPQLQQPPRAQTAMGRQKPSTLDGVLPSVMLKSHVVPQQDGSVYDPNIERTMSTTLPASRRPGSATIEVLRCFDQKQSMAPSNTLLTDDVRCGGNTVKKNKKSTTTTSTRPPTADASVMLSNRAKTPNTRPSSSQAVAIRCGSANTVVLPPRPGSSLLSANRPPTVPSQSHLTETNATTTMQNTNSNNTSAVVSAASTPGVLSLQERRRRTSSSASRIGQLAQLVHQQQEAKELEEREKQRKLESTSDLPTSSSVEKLLVPEDEEFGTRPNTVGSAATAIHEEEDCKEHHNYASSSGIEDASSGDELRRHEPSNSTRAPPPAAAEKQSDAPNTVVEVVHTDLSQLFVTEENFSVEEATTKPRRPNNERKDLDEGDFDANFSVTSAHSDIGRAVKKSMNDDNNAATHLSATPRSHDHTANRTKSISNSSASNLSDASNHHLSPTLHGESMRQKKKRGSSRNLSKLRRSPSNLSTRSRGTNNSSSGPTPRGQMAKTDYCDYNDEFYFDYYDNTLTPFQRQQRRLNIPMSPYERHVAGLDDDVVTQEDVSKKEQQSSSQRLSSKNLQRLQQIAANKKKKTIGASASSTKGGKTERPTTANTESMAFMLTSLRPNAVRAGEKIEANRRSQIERQWIEELRAFAGRWELQRSNIQVKETNDTRDIIVMEEREVSHRAVVISSEKAAWSTVLQKEKLSKLAAERADPKNNPNLAVAVRRDSKMSRAASRRSSQVSQHLGAPGGLNRGASMRSIQSFRSGQSALKPYSNKSSFVYNGPRLGEAASPFTHSLLSFGSMRKLYGGGPGSSAGDRRGSQSGGGGGDDLPQYALDAVKRAQGVMRFQRKKQIEREEANAPVGAPADRARQKLMAASSSGNSPLSPPQSGGDGETVPIGSEHDGIDEIVDSMGLGADASAFAAANNMGMMGGDEEATPKRLTRLEERWEKDASQLAKKLFNQLTAAQGSAKGKGGEGMPNFMRSYDPDRAEQMPKHRSNKKKKKKDADGEDTTPRASTSMKQHGSSIKQSKKQHSSTIRRDGSATAIMASGEQHPEADNQEEVFDEDPAVVYDHHALFDYPFVASDEEDSSSSGYSSSSYDESEAPSPAASASVEGGGGNVLAMAEMSTMQSPYALMVSDPDAAEKPGDALNATRSPSAEQLTIPEIRGREKMRQKRREERRRRKAIEARKKLEEEAKGGPPPARYSLIDAAWWKKVGASFNTEDADELANVALRSEVFFPQELRKPKKSFFQQQRDAVTKSHQSLGQLRQQNEQNLTKKVSVAASMKEMLKNGINQPAALVAMMKKQSAQSLLNNRQAPQRQVKQLTKRQIAMHAGLTTAAFGFTEDANDVRKSREKAALAQAEAARASRADRLLDDDDADLSGESDGERKRRQRRQSVAPENFAEGSPLSPKKLIEWRSISPPAPDHTEYFNGVEIDLLDGWQTHQQKALGIFTQQQQYGSMNMSPYGSGFGAFLSSSPASFNWGDPASIGSVGDLRSSWQAELAKETSGGYGGGGSFSAALGGIGSQQSLRSGSGNSPQQTPMAPITTGIPEGARQAILLKLQEGRAAGYGSQKLQEEQKNKKENEAEGGDSSSPAEIHIDHTPFGNCPPSASASPNGDTTGLLHPAVRRRSVTIDDSTAPLGSGEHITKRRHSTATTVMMEESESQFEEQSVDRDMLLSSADTNNMGRLSPVNSNASGSGNTSPTHTSHLKKKDAHDRSPGPLNPAQLHAVSSPTQASSPKGHSSPMGGSASPNAASPPRRWSTVLLEQAQLDDDNGEVDLINLQSPVAGGAVDTGKTKKDARSPPATTTKNDISPSESCREPPANIEETMKPGGAVQHPDDAAHSNDGGDQGDNSDDPLQISSEANFEPPTPVIVEKEGHVPSEEVQPPADKLLENSPNTTAHQQEFEAALKRYEADHNGDDDGLQREEFDVAPLPPPDATLMSSDDEAAAFIVDDTDGSEEEDAEGSSISTLERTASNIDQRAARKNLKRLSADSAAENTSLPPAPAIAVGDPDNDAWDQQQQGGKGKPPISGGGAGGLHRLKSFSGSIRTSSVSSAVPKESEINRRRQSTMQLERIAGLGQSSRKGNELPTRGAAAREVNLGDTLASSVRSLSATKNQDRRVSFAPPGALSESRRDGENTTEQPLIVDEVQSVSYTPEEMHLASASTEDNSQQDANAKSSGGKGAPRKTSLGVSTPTNDGSNKSSPSHRRRSSGGGVNAVRQQRGRRHRRRRNSSSSTGGDDGTSSSESDNELIPQGTSPFYAREPEEASDQEAGPPPEAVFAQLVMDMTDDEDDEQFLAGAVNDDLTLNPPMRRESTFIPEAIAVDSPTPSVGSPFSPMSNSRRSDSLFSPTGAGAGSNGGSPSNMYYQNFHRNSLFGPEQLKRMSLVSPTSAATSPAAATAKRGSTATAQFVANQGDFGRAERTRFTSTVSVDWLTSENGDATPRVFGSGSADGRRSTMGGSGKGALPDFISSVDEEDEWLLAAMTELHRNQKWCLDEEDF